MGRRKRLGSHTPRMLEIFATCRKKYEMAHVNGLRRAGRGKLSLKELLAELFRARDIAIAMSIADVPRVMNTALHMWKAQVTQEGFNQEEIREICDEANNIAAYYHATHLSEDRRLSFKQVEASRLRNTKSKKLEPLVGRILEGRILNPKTRRQSMSKVAIRLDGVVMHECSTGMKPALLVRYFTSNPNRQEVESELRERIDWRPHLWLAMHLLKVPIDRIVFDVVRTKAPREPKMLKCTKCKGKGCEECANTGVGLPSSESVDTTLRVWSSAVLKHKHLDTDKIKEKCGRVIDRLKVKGETFAYRFETPVSPAGGVHWEREAWEVFSDIKRQRRREIWPKNIGACKGVHGLCSFLPACREEDSESIAWYVKADDKYPGESNRREVAEEAAKLIMEWNMKEAENGGSSD